HTATIAEVRPMLEAEARKTAAAEKVYEISQKYDDAHAGGASLPEAAQKAGVQTVTVGPVSEQGADPQGQRAAGVTQKLVQVAFGLPQGGESEIEDEGAGESFAVRVEKIIPKALPPLADVKPRLTQVWMARETAKRLQVKADELTARVKKGESLEAVAASVGAQVSHVAALDRQTAGQNKELSQDALGKAFNAKPGEAFSAENAKAFGLIVGKLEAIHAPNPAQIARIAEDSRPQMTMGLFREIGADARRSARTTIKPKIYPNVARAALGLEPLEAKAKKKPEKAQ
ncbi:MAG TPA: rotamase, partial [Phenylobacterium sp.]|nr:rotamase [Phenylobacterium sp.]